jgi:ATP-dependent Clp protease ATP-binding subunit ClpA
MTVFDRCDAETMRVVDAAIRVARELGHSYIGTEHLLLAFSEHREVLPEHAARLLPTASTVRSGISAVIGEPLQRDTELLRSIGVDLEEVRSAVRRTFGDDAVDRLRRRGVHQPWQPWRRPSRRCTSLLARTGTMTVSRRVKQAFERATREADRRGLSLIEPSVLLLGVVEVEDALANRLLRANGIDPFEIRGLLVEEH